MAKETKDNSWLVPLFEANPELEEIWAVDKTKQGFYKQDDAISHAAFWAAEEPRKVTRLEVEALIAEAEKAKAAEEVKKAKAAEEVKKAKAAEEEMTSDKWTVAKLQEWLTAKEIAFDEKATKAQLLALVPAEQ